MSGWVYMFGDGKAEGASQMRDLLGGKGANLAEMANLGLPVPPGFTITTEVCDYFYKHGKSYPPELAGDVEAAGVLLADRTVGVLRRTLWGDSATGQGAAVARAASPVHRSAPRRSLRGAVQ